MARIRCLRWVLCGVFLFAPQNFVLSQSTIVICDANTRQPLGKDANAVITFHYNYLVGHKNVPISKTRRWVGEPIYLNDPVTTYRIHVEAPGFEALTQEGSLNKGDSKRPGQFKTREVMRFYLTATKPLDRSVAPQKESPIQRGFGLTLQETTRQLGLDQQTVLRFIHQNKLPAQKTKDGYLVKLADVSKFKLSDVYRAEIASIHLIEQGPVHVYQDTWLQNPHLNYPFYFKGQTHAHTTCSDGEVSPDSVEKLYRDHGYQFVCVTDHCAATPDPHVGGIVHITSGEDNWLGGHHLLILGIDFSKIDPSVDPNGNGLADANSQDCWNCKERIDYATKTQGAIGVIAHPSAGHVLSGDHLVSFTQGWSMEELADPPLSGYSGIEIFNGSYTVGDDGRWSETMWDKALNTGISRFWCFAGDDFHRFEQHSFNRGWVVVNSNKSSPTKSDILHNIKIGNFYAVVRGPNDVDVGNGSSDMGPKLVVTVHGGDISVSTDAVCESIYLAGNQSVPIFAVAHVSSAKFSVSPTEDYVRVVVHQRRQTLPGQWELYRAFSQPIFVAHRQGIKGNIFGRVGQTEFKVHGAHIVAFSERGPAHGTNSNSDGAYSLALPVGRHRVYVHSSDPEIWADFSAFVDVTDGFKVHDFTLPKTEHDGRILR